MIMVYMAMSREDYCGLCGGKIPKGHIFVLAWFQNPKGKDVLRACHLRCFAKQRAREKCEVMQGPALPLPPAPIKEGEAGGP